MTVSSRLCMFLCGLFVAIGIRSFWDTSQGGGWASMLFCFFFALMFWGASYSEHQQP